MDQNYATRAALLALKQILDEPRVQPAKEATESVTEPTTVVMEGVLEKQSSGSVQRWQPRYFLLNSDGILMYRAAHRAEATPKTVVDVDELLKVSLAIHPDGQYEIVLHPLGYVMRSADAAIAKRWHKSIARAQKKKQRTPCLVSGIGHMPSDKSSTCQKAQQALSGTIDSTLDYGSIPLSAEKLKRLSAFISPTAAVAVTACDLSNSGLTSACAVHLAPLLLRLSFLCSLNLANNSLHSYAFPILASAIGELPSLRSPGCCCGRESGRTHVQEGE